MLWGYALKQMPAQPYMNREGHSPLCVISMQYTDVAPCADVMLKPPLPHENLPTLTLSSRINVRSLDTLAEDNSLFKQGHGYEVPGTIHL